MVSGRGRLVRVLAACGLYSLVEYLYWAAVLIVAYQSGGATVAGLVLLVQLLPAALLAAPLTSVVDRLPRGAALAGAYLVEAVALVALTLTAAAQAPLPVIVLLASLATVTVSVPRPLHYAALPQLAPTPRTLVRANAASSVLDGVGVFAGPALAGLLLHAQGLTAAVGACAVAMVAAAVLCLRLGLPRTHGDGDEQQEGALSGVRTVARDRPVLVLLLLVGLSYVVTGSFEILGVAFASSALGEGESAAGLLIGAAGLGLLVGSLASAGVATRPHLTGPVLLALGAAGLPLLVMVAAGALPAAVLLLALCGAGLAVSSVAGRTLLQRTTDGGLLARVFAVQEAVLLLGLAVGAVVAPALVAWIGPAWAYLPIGAALLAAALLALPAVRALDGRARVRTDVVTLLRGIPWLAPMPPPQLERLAQSSHWVQETTGTVVIRQGDLGDAFYAVASGRLSVTIDAVVRPHTLGPGDGFGEIALLQDIPRTATITALEACRLVRIERADFLAAVTGSADGARIAAEVASAHLARDEHAR